MYYHKRRLLTALFSALLLGALLHFVYTWFPSAVTALFSPINESLWERLKILFWPFLLTALWLTWGRPGAMRPFFLALPLMCLLMLVLGYLYHVTLRGEALWVDLLLFLAIMSFGFWLATRFSGPFSSPLWLIPGAAVLVLALLLVLFTLWPPQTLLFADLSSAGAWFPLPC